MSTVDISSGSAESAPTGRWRNGLCDCCETIATGRFWMGWCLNCVLQGQLLERFHLNLFGMKGPEPMKHVCMIYSIASLVLYVLLVSVQVPAVVSIGKCYEEIVVSFSMQQEGLDDSLCSSHSLDLICCVACGCGNLHSIPYASKVPNSRKYLRRRIFG
jgi:hypothetical protein